MTKWIVVALAFAFIANLSLAVEDDEEEPANYTGCQLIRVTSLLDDTDKGLEDLSVWKTLYHEAVPGVSVWSGPIDGASEIDVQVCPEAKEEFLANFTSDNTNLNITVQIDDLQKVIDEQKQHFELGGRFDKTAQLESFVLERYHDLAEIYDFLDVASNFNPALMTVSNIGTTFQKRDMKMVKLGYNSSTGASKPAIWLDFGIHSREWITVASAVHFIHQMVTANNSHTESLLKTFDWFVLPVANPDGYVYSWTTNRLWRKNRSKTGSGCFGVDLNRNFDIDFFGLSSSFTSPCSNQYRGTKPFSEQESEAIRTQVSSLKNHLKAFVSVHSYSQLWLLPYGYKKQRPNHFQDIHAVAKMATESLTKINGIKYKLGSISELLYTTSGSSIDWAYDVIKVKYSYGIELRDRGQYGFLLPASQIVPASEELNSALGRMALEIARREKIHIF